MAVIALIASLGGPEPALAAIPLPRLKLVQIERLPPVRGIVVPRPSRAGFYELRSRSEYGTDDALTTRALDDAKASEVSAIERTAERVAYPERAEQLVKQCVGKGLNEVATSYRNAVLAAAITNRKPIWPDFEDGLSGALEACLQASFPAEPLAEVHDLAASLTDQTTHKAEAASSSARTGMVFATWLTSTAAGVSVQGMGASAESGIPTDMPETTVGEGEGSSFPWWIVIVAALLAGGGLVLAARRARGER